MNKKNINEIQLKLLIEKKYQPEVIEEIIYKYWENGEYFKPNGNNKESFCIVNPPPNITGNLHMGHAFQQTIMDVLIRYHRMQGKNTLWQSGTDHAGIATQIIIENKLIAEENKTRLEYGKINFIKKIWQWTEESKKNISKQMKSLGNSINWQSERFTMDKGFSKAVKQAFICLYENNLIYRRKRLVNWDPKLQTTISDLEIENRETHSFIWYIKYPLADGIKTISGNNYIVVATTRPETLFGDTGISVNPEDIRYKNLIGKYILLPLLNRRIPIIGDKNANIDKGTGCVKITPAHDFKDYEVCQRHKLPIINIFDHNACILTKAEIFNSDGTLSNVHKNTIPIHYQGMERFCARKTIIQELEKLQLLVTKKPYKITIPYGDRSGVIIEPMLKNQWYIKTQPLAKQAILAVKNGFIKFIPKQYENMYFSWMQNLQDWCISRQLWWGHKIPAWYDTTGNVYVGYNETEIRYKNHIDPHVKLTQDNDVLDTWFSSSLWTFVSLGWPDDNEKIKIFHPTNVLISGFDIIFFWIARMIMLTMYFIKNKNGQGQVPFKTVYITGLIRDEKGKKMSKSKGNVIDPLDLIHGISLEKLLIKRTANMMQPQLAKEMIKRTCKEYPKGIKAYGTDALRFTLMTLASTRQEINWDMQRLTGYYKFCNKLWHASYYVISNTIGHNYNQKNKNIDFSLSDRWIITIFNKTVKIYREALDSYRFDLAANILYDFIWNQFCDWYLELSKIIINHGNNEEIYATRYTLINILERLLRLSHPIISFMTETIWQHVKLIMNIKNDTIMLQSFPIFKPHEYDQESIDTFELIKEIIIAIRKIRIEIHIPQRQLLDIILYIKNQNINYKIIRNKKFIKLSSYTNSITILNKKECCPPSIIQNFNNGAVLFPISNIINKNSILTLLNKEFNELTEKISNIENKFKNKNFVENTPKDIIKKEYARLQTYITAKQKLINQKSNVILN